MRSRLTVLSGPSGVGKGTVVEAVRRHHPQIWVSVSVTTRHPRPGERAGVHYRFVSRPEFDEMVTSGALLEHAEFAGHGYGTPRAPLERELDRGSACLLEIELLGARQVRAADPQAQLVFLQPPSWDELERRLRRRRTESEDVIAARLDRARTEMQARAEFDAVIVNDEVERAAAELVGLVKSGCPDGDHAGLDSPRERGGPPAQQRPPTAISRDRPRP